MRKPAGQRPASRSEQMTRLRAWPGRAADSVSRGRIRHARSWQAVATHAATSGRGGLRELALRQHASARLSIAPVSSEIASSMATRCFSRRPSCFSDFSSASLQLLGVGAGRIVEIDHLLHFAQREADLATKQDQLEAGDVATRIEPGRAVALGVEQALVLVEAQACEASRHTVLASSPMRVKPSPASDEPCARNVVIAVGRIIVGRNHLHHFFCFPRQWRVVGRIAPDGSLGGSGFRSWFQHMQRAADQRPALTFTSII